MKTVLSIMLPIFIYYNPCFVFFIRRLILRLWSLNRNEYQSTFDSVLSRFTQIKDDMPQEIKDKFSALDDFTKMEFSDSRYLQSLSDKKSALSSFINDYDKKVSEMKDSDEKSKLASARKNLDNYILSMFSDESSDD